MRRAIVTSVVGAAVAAVAWFIWPSPYNYSQAAGQFFRINRFTGIREQSMNGAWRTDDAIASIAKDEAQKKAQRDREIQESLDSIDRMLAQPEQLNTLKWDNPKIIVASTVSYVGNEVRAVLKFSGAKGSFSTWRRVSTAFFVQLKDASGYAIASKTVSLNQAVTVIDDDEKTETTTLAFKEQIETGDVGKITEWAGMLR